MSNYELPSMYNNQQQRGGFVDSEDEEEAVVDTNYSTNALPTRSTFKDVHVEDNRLAWLLLGASFFILIMTVIPVLADIPNISPWFTGDALFRFFDPLITLPLNLFIMTRADIMTNGKTNYCK